MRMAMAEVEEYLNSFPPGYKFDPSDDELIIEYLLPKINEGPMHSNLMHDVNIYQHNPDSLAEKYPPQGNKGWYFFTSRDKKYLNGTRPNRKAGDGYWKATGADKAILHNGIEVGFRKALVFYKGRPPKGEKTLWIMHEFRVVGPSQVKKREHPLQVKKREHPPINDGDEVRKRKHSSITNGDEKKENTSMRLDDTILCRIYKKNEVTPKDKSPREQQQEAENESFESQIDEAVEAEISSSKESPVIDDINCGGNMYDTSNHPCHNVDMEDNNNEAPNVNTYGANNNNGCPNVNKYNNTSTNEILNVNSANNVDTSYNADIHNVNMYTTGYCYGDYPSFIGSISTNQLMVNSSSIYGLNNVNPKTSYAAGLLFDRDSYLTSGNYTFSEDLIGDYNNDDYEQLILHLLLEPENPTMAADQDPNPMATISERNEAVNMHVEPNTTFD